jgi:hypothetical protein
MFHNSEQKLYSQLGWKTSFKIQTNNYTTSLAVRHLSKSRPKIIQTARLEDIVEQTSNFIHHSHKRRPSKMQ